MSFYNTTNETGETLKRYKEKALSQDELIMQWLNSFAGHSKLYNGFTPSQINRHVLPNAPLTSVRRSMNTLTKKGYLVKTNEKREGSFGRPEHTWKLADPKQGELI